MSWLFSDKDIARGNFKKSQFERCSDLDFLKLLSMPIPGSLNVDDIYIAHATDNDLDYRVVVFKEEDELFGYSVHFKSCTGYPQVRCYKHVDL